MRLILLGPAGAGKGTQARLIQDHFSIPHLSSGDILRQMAEEDSDIGRQIQAELTAGRLISDEMMISMLKEVINSPKCANGFILDGFVRTLPQAEALDRMLVGQKQELDVVISLMAEEEALVTRLLGRYTCESCGEGYHDQFKKPKKEGVCDICGGTRFSRRTDDTDEGIRRRLKAYQEQTAPIIPYYEKQGKLRTVDALREISQVWLEIKAILSHLSS